MDYSHEGERIPDARAPGNQSRTNPQSDDPSQESPGQSSAPRDQSQKVPQRRQTFEKGVSGESSDSHNVVVEQPDIWMGSEEESTDLLVVRRKISETNTSKPICWHKVYTFSLIRMVKSVSSRRLPEVRAETAWKHKETLLTCRTNMVMLSRRIISSQ